MVSLNMKVEMIPTSRFWDIIIKKSWKTQCHLLSYIHPNVISTYLCHVITDIVATKFLSYLFHLFTDWQTFKKTVISHHHKTYTVFRTSIKKRKSKISTNLPFSSYVYRKKEKLNPFWYHWNSSKCVFTLL